MDLSVDGLTDAELQHLAIEHTSVTDEGLEHLKGLMKLNHLSLFGTQVTDAGVKDL
ncbi:MAG: hypothetical protein ABGZ35_05265 [Planctomycetaceae bacterium]